MREAHESVARGKLEIARSRLVHNFPFYAGVAAAFKISISTRVERVEISVRGDFELHLAASPNFVERVKLDELENVLCHEVLHVLFQHVEVDRSMFENQTARIVAEEVTVNEFTPKPLPGEPVTLESVNSSLRKLGLGGLPRGEDTDTRYEKLKKSWQKDPRLGQKIAASCQKMGAGIQKHDPSGKNSGSSVLTLDNHSAWGKVNTTVADLVARGAVQVAKDTCGKHWDRHVASEVRRSVEGLLAGKRPGEEIEEIQHGESAENWRKVLRRFVGRELKCDLSYRFPSRRLPDLVGIIPGRRLVGGRLRVMAVIDTSASIDTDTLSDISAELAAQSRHTEVTVVECDTKIHRVYRFSRPIKSVRGRGGTDLRPPLRLEFLQKHRPDLITFFTDGYGPAPKEKPPVSVLWCLTQGGKRPATWGRMVRLGEG